MLPGTSFSYIIYRSLKWVYVLKLVQNLPVFYSDTYNTITIKDWQVLYQFYNIANSVMRLWLCNRHRHICFAVQYHHLTCICLGDDCHRSRDRASGRLLKLTSFPTCEPNKSLNCGSPPQLEQRLMPNLVLHQ